MKSRKWKKKIIISSIVFCLSVMSVSGLTINYIISHRQAVENNGYYDGSGKFDKKMTPVSNMLLLLKVLNGSNFCDEDWYKEVVQIQGILQCQVDCNSTSRDPYVRKMMDLQMQIIKKLRAFTTSAWLTQLSDYDINELKKSYDAYHDYYYQNYPEGEEL